VRRPKSFAWFYLWMLLTSGLFSVYWLYSLMEDINALAKRRIFRSGLAVTPLLLGFAGVIGGLVFMSAFQDAFMSNDAYQSAYVAVCIFAEVALFATGVSVYRGYLKLVGKPFGISDFGFAIGTSLMMFLLYPYVQIRVNDRLAGEAQAVS